MSVVTVLAPIAGRVVAMSAVPDPVFAESMLGPGLAIDPALVDKADVLSPVDGIVRTVLPHAVAVQTADGHAVLVHLGLDTVELHGVGFVLGVAKGAPVDVGQMVISWSPKEIAAKGHNVVTAVVALEADPGELTMLAKPGDEVSPGDPLFEWDKPPKAARR
jgi:glucose-specific phosphotransferase system IIA component